MFNIGDKLTKENYTQGAIWCNENNAKIEIIDGEYIIVAIPDSLPPTKEEQQKARENAYKAKVDPITCHINRLKDEEQTEEVIAEIASLVEERKAKVDEIKQRFPYPVEETNISDSVLSEAPENKGQSENESKEVIEDGLQR